MGSRMMHLAAAKLFCGSVTVSYPDRFKFGAILPDAENGDHGKDTHFNKVTPDGKKFFDLRSFREEYRDGILSDSLYLGYYLHLVADAVYRYYVYEKHGWDPSVPGNVGRLHNDYRLTNAYIAVKYGLKYDIVIPAGIEKERIVRVFPFIIEEFYDEMKSDFTPYCSGEPFFFTNPMADEYIRLAADVGEKEYSAFVCGKGPVFDYSWK